MAMHDLLGNICIVKFKRDVLLRDKKKWAKEFMSIRPSVSTVLEKVDKFKGRLRTAKTKWILGEKTKEALYKENGCEFRLNIDSCYFSPRLASERKELTGKVKKDEEVLVMFGGVAPFGIVIAKGSKASKIISVELGRECTRYAEINIKRNKLVGRVEAIGGDVRRVLGTHLSAVKSKSMPSYAPIAKELSSVRKRIGKDKNVDNKFDRIVMARPNLKDSFLDVAFKVIRKGGAIHYYGFYPEDEVDKLREMIEDEAKKAKRKIKIMKIKKAGEIGTRKFRFRVDLKIIL